MEHRKFCNVAKWFFGLLLLDQLSALAAIGINQGPKSFGSPFFGGCNMLLADGSVLFISESIAPDVLKALSTPASGERVPEF